jgi:hypothetical protein
MPGPYKGTIFLNTADAGWTETYYFNAASLSAAASLLGAIETPRMGLARAEVKCAVLRVVDLSTPRVALLGTPPTAAGTWSGADLSTIDPAIAVLSRMTVAAGTTRSRHYLRGIPSAQITGSATDPITWAFTSGYLTALTTWVNAVIANAVLAVKGVGRSYTTIAISTITQSTIGTFRRAGRPFGLRRGRRLLV